MSRMSVARRESTGPTAPGEPRPGRSVPPRCAPGPDPGAGEAGLLARLASPGASLRVPALAALPDGTLLLVHDRRPLPVGESWRRAGGALPDDLPNPNTLWLRSSSDCGATWSPPQRLDPDLPGITGISDPSLIVAPCRPEPAHCGPEPPGPHREGHRIGALGPTAGPPAGDRRPVVHLLATAAGDVGLFGAHPPARRARPGQTPEPGTLRLLHATSRDCGATWCWRDITDAALPSTAWPNGAVLFTVSGHGLALRHPGRTGRLIQPVVAALEPGPDGARPLRSACLLSEDSGASWHLGEAVPTTAATGAASLSGGAATCGVDEHAVVELADGRLLTSARDGAYAGTRLSAWSIDGGQSWSAAHRQNDLPDPGCNAGLAALPDGRLLLSHAANSTARREGRLSLSVEGASWRPLVRLRHAEIPFGYSDLALVPAGRTGATRAVVVAEEPAPEGTTLVVLAVAVD